MASKNVELAYTTSPYVFKQGFDRSSVAFLLGKEMKSDGFFRDARIKYFNPIPLSFLLPYNDALNSRGDFEFS